jgi:hypothetical protein
LTEEQYQHIQEEIKHSIRTHLSEGILGGYELCLQVGIPNVFKSFLSMKMANTIDWGRWITNLPNYEIRSARKIYFTIGT